MTHMRVKGFKIFRDRYGKMRCYHRATGTAIDLDKAPIRSLEFLAECARISELTSKSGPARPGTLNMLVTEYRASMAFADPSSRTHRATAQVSFLMADASANLADLPGLLHGMPRRISDRELGLRRSSKQRVRRRHGHSPP